jgi:HTH-type transcriptional regulator / antitoxin HigA
MKREIHNAEEHKQAIQRLELLTDKGEAGNIPEAELMEIDYLSMLIESYEDKHFPIGQPNPVEYLKYILENKHMRQQDLVNLLGISKGTLSNILNYRKKLSIEMIRSLHNRLKIPYDILMEDYELQC